MKKKPKWEPVGPEIEAKIKKLAKEGKIECAPQDKLEEVMDVAYDFVDNVLDFDGAFITDLSRISDFGLEEEELEMVIDLAKARYGVDITEVMDEYLVDIAAFIQEESKKRETS